MEHGKYQTSDKLSRGVWSGHLTPPFLNFGTHV